MFTKNSLSPMTNNYDKLNAFYISLKIKWEEVKIAFVLSTGRTGTEFFAHFFNDNFYRVRALHEPVPDFFDLGVQSIRGRCSRKQVVDKIKRSRSTMIEPLQRENIFYLESNTNLVLLLPPFEGNFPKSKVYSRG